MRKQQRLHEQQLKHIQNHRISAYRAISIFIFIGMLVANIVIFAQSVRLADQIVHLETQTKTLQKQNALLQQKVYTQSSLSNLGELADQLGFTKEAEPVHLDSPEYALVP